MIILWIGFVIHIEVLILWINDLFVSYDFVENRNWYDIPLQGKPTVLETPLKKSGKKGKKKNRFANERFILSMFLYFPLFGCFVFIIIAMFVRIFSSAVLFSSRACLVTLSLGTECDRC